MKNRIFRQAAKRAKEAKHPKEAMINCFVNTLHERLKKSALALRDLRLGKSGGLKITLGGR